MWQHYKVRAAHDQLLQLNILTTHDNMALHVILHVIHVCTHCVHLNHSSFYCIATFCSTVNIVTVLL